MGFADDEFAVFQPGGRNGGNLLTVKDAGAPVADKDGLSGGNEQVFLGPVMAKDGRPDAHQVMHAAAQHRDGSNAARA